MEVSTLRASLEEKDVSTMSLHVASPIVVRYVHVSVTRRSCCIKQTRQGISFLLHQGLSRVSLLVCAKGWSEESAVGGEHWHRMVKLHVSEEATWLHNFVEDTLSRFRRKSAEAAVKRGRGEAAGKDATTRRSGTSSDVVETEFMCAHVRRQDFEASCARYEEEFQSGRCVMIGFSRIN